MAVSRLSQIFEPTVDNGNSEWWKQHPCPHSSSWGLHTIKERDHRMLKNKIANSTHFTNHMIVETHIYRAFLEYPVGEFHMKERSNPSEALRFLQSAEDYTNDTHVCTIEGRIGYGIVINAFRMWIDSTDEFSSKLENLLKERDVYPSSESFVTATHAYILSKLGPRWFKECIRLYSRVLRSFPGNTEWRFEMARMVGKETRELRLALDIQRPSPGFIRKGFEEERDLLMSVLSRKPNFHYARALFGQALYFLSWKDSNAGRQIGEAFEMEPTNPDICIIFARYHRRKGSMDRALEVLNTHVNSTDAEIHSQLGYLYRKMGFKRENRYTEYMELALTHFKRAVKLNNCHYPSISSVAEITALLVTTGETALVKDRKEESEDSLKGMFRMFRDDPSDQFSTVEFTAIKQGIEKDFFGVTFGQSEVIRLSYRCVTLAMRILRKYKEKIGSGDLVSCMNNMIRRPTKYLEDLTHEEDPEIRSLATLNLAHVYRIAGRFDEAEQLYDDLPEGAGIVCGQAELYLSKGRGYALQRSRLAESYWQKSLELTDKLNMINGTSERSPTELYADIYLARAKFNMRTDYSLSGYSIEEWMKCSTAADLTKAISHNSLEACYLFLRYMPSVGKNFFSPGVVQMLAQIASVCRGDNCHHGDFLVDTGPVVVQVDAAIKEFILSEVRKATKYDASVYPSSGKFGPVFKMLEKLRKERLDFENLLLGADEFKWQDQLENALIAVLRTARESLDAVIAVCQESLMEPPLPSNSMFVVMFDWNEGITNPTKARKEVAKWAAKVFKGLEKPPGELCTRVEEMQPMFDDDNLWLIGLASFNNVLKHRRSGLVFGETFPLQLKKPENDPKCLELSTRCIVQRSCEEVEKFVFFCAERYGGGGNPD